MKWYLRVYCLRRYTDAMNGYSTKGAFVKRTILGMAEAGEPLMQQALDANRAYQAAVDQNRLAEEVERLRIEADHLSRRSLTTSFTKTAPWVSRCTDVECSQLATRNSQLRKTYLRAPA